MSRILRIGPAKKGRWGIDFSLNYIKPFLMPEDYEGSMASAYSL